MQKLILLTLSISFTFLELGLDRSNSFAATSATTQQLQPTASSSILLAKGCTLRRYRRPR